MKGIAGIVYPDVFQVNHQIFPMLDVIQEGNEGVRDLHTYNNIQIGTAGSKLAVSEKKTIIGGMDGIIYNAKELKDELRKQGYHFRSENPAEIIVHAYELWDKKFLEKIDGDFAVMILDPIKKRIIIARDRIGKQPLYWFQCNNHFVFGSQLKALLATGVVPQAPAPDALSSYLYFGYLPQDLTPLKDVNKLLPGHYLQYNFNQSKTIEPFWSYSSFFENPIIKHKNTIANLLDQHLERSVKKRLLGDTDKIGAFVSGGLGSASIAYYVNKAMPRHDLQCFSVGFEKENEEDIEAAKLVSKRLGLVHETDFVKPSNFLDDLVKVIWHLDEPIADPNIIATWKLAALAAKNTSTVFSGMGSDELFAGHNRYIVSERHLNALSRLMPLIYKFLIPLINAINPPWAYRLLKHSRTDPWQFEYMSQNALFDERMISKASPLLSGLFDPEVFLHKFYHLSRIKSTVSSFLYFDVKTRLVDNYIMQVGSLTQAQGLTWNTPFLDQELIEFLASFVDPQHLAESETGTFLKLLMKDILPEAVVDRPKKKRSHFLSAWMEQSQMPAACALLEKGTLVETGLLSVEWLRKSLASPEERQKNYQYLWAFLTLEIWFQLMINRPISSHNKELSIEELI